MAAGNGYSYSHIERQAFGFGALQHQRSNVVDKIPHRTVGHFEIELGRFDLGKVEDIIDQKEQALGISADRRRCSRRSCGVQIDGHEQIRESQDGRHGRANLVAHVGEEFAFGATGGLGGEFRPRQFLLGRLAFGNVDDHTVETDRTPASVVDGTAPFEDPSQLSIRSSDAVLQVERAPAGGGFPDSFRNVQPILFHDQFAEASLLLAVKSASG